MMLWIMELFVSMVRATHFAPDFFIIITAVHTQCVASLPASVVTITPPASHAAPYVTHGT
jgi:hypothetical protein